MDFKFFLTVNGDGEPDVIFINDMWVGDKFRARAFFRAHREALQVFAADPDSDVTQIGEGRFILGGPLP